MTGEATLPGNPKEETARRRRRILGLVLAAGLVAGLGTLLGGVPREVTVAYDLGPDAGAVRRLLVRYEQGGALVEQVEWRFSPGETPARVEHVARMPEGTVELRLSLWLGEGAEPVREVRQVDGDGFGDRIVLHLHDLVGAGPAKAGG